MTTKKQIKTLFGLLASRHDDLIVRGRFVVVAPLRHVLRAISIDRTSDADFPCFFWHVGHSFNPLGGLGGLSAEWFPLPKGGPQRWSDPDFSDTMINVIEQRLLPMLRRVRMIDDMYRVEGEPRSYAYDDWLNHHEPYRIQLLAALGLFEEAIPIYDKIKDWHLTMKNGWRSEFEHASRLGDLIAAGDRPAAAALLHQWEEEFAARNDLLPIYERTPFPLELQQQP
ncbi:MAG: hypothetical protein QHC89_29700 [Bosea sp. (in: a-proteobacteria)]|nr:hypothetical protein [Bosea sp. (in: a-proteobacteria)]